MIWYYIFSYSLNLKFKGKYTYSTKLVMISHNTTHWFDYSNETSWNILVFKKSFSWPLSTHINLKEVCVALYHNNINLVLRYYECAHSPSRKVTHLSARKTFLWYVAIKKKTTLNLPVRTETLAICRNIYRLSRETLHPLFSFVELDTTIACC